MNVSTGPLSPLAALLRLMVVEYPVMPDLTLLAAKDVLNLVPDCYRAHESMCRVGGVSNLHEATTAGPAIFARTTKQELLALETLPSSIKTHFENPEGDETTVWKLLDQAGEPGATPASHRGRCSADCFAKLGLYKCSGVLALCAMAGAYRFATTGSRRCLWSLIIPIGHILKPWFGLPKRQTNP